MGMGSVFELLESSDIWVRNLDFYYYYYYEAHLHTRGVHLAKISIIYIYLYELFDIIRKITG